MVSAVHHSCACSSSSFLYLQQFIVQQFIPVLRAVHHSCTFSSSSPCSSSFLYFQQFIFPVRRAVDHSCTCSSSSFLYSSFITPINGFPFAPRHQHHVKPPNQNQPQHQQQHQHHQQPASKNCAAVIQQSTCAEQSHWPRFEPS